MENLTKRQRREIYLKAALLAYKMRNNGFGYLCFILGQLLKSSRNYESSSDILPEFEMFKPEYSSHSDTWFDDIENNGERIICMLLCAEMCKD